MEDAGDTGQVLTIEEIDERFDSEWVLIEDPMVGKANEVLSGRVRWHSTDKDDVYRKLDELGIGNWAVLFVGTVAEDAVIVL